MDIYGRTAFFEVGIKEGVHFIRFYDWTRINTDRGLFLEPHLFHQRIPYGLSTNDLPVLDYESDDHMVNELQQINLDTAGTIVGCDVHGGNLIPRVGR